MSLTHRIFRSYSAQQVAEDEQFEMICPECWSPGHADGHDPRMCILEMWRRGEVQTFNDWAPMAKAEGAKARAEAAAFLGRGAAPVTQAAAIAAAPIPELPAPAAAAAAPAAAPTPTKPSTERKCSVCRQPGHTKKGCKGTSGAAAAGGGAAQPEPEPELTWEKVSAYTTDVSLPAGRYYLSDLCYALPDPIYDEVWGKQFNYNSGVYRRSDGAMFIVDHTAYGDGAYRGSDDKTYGVDAGVIAIVSAALTDAPYGGTWQELKKPGNFSADGGVFYLEGAPGEAVYVRIDTTGDGDEDEDEEDGY
jgi:hypothetical protein